jgi:hypothetical protein
VCKLPTKTLGSWGKKKSQPGQNYGINVNNLPISIFAEVNASEQFLFVSSYIACMLFITSTLWAAVCLMLGWRGHQSTYGFNRE